MSVDHQYIEAPRSRTTLLDTWDRHLATIGTVALLLFVTHAFHFAFVAPADDGSPTELTVRNSPIYLGFFALQFGLFLFLFVWNVLIHGVPRQLGVVMCIVAFVALSMMWSIDPGMTLSHSILFAYMAIGAFVVSIYFDPARFLRLYVHLGAFLSTASLLLLAISPDLAHQPVRVGDATDVPLFQGVFIGKNTAGHILASFFLVSVMGRDIGLSTAYRLSVAAAALAGIILANSVTALALALGLPLLWVAIRFVSSRPSILYYLAYVILLLACIVTPFLLPGSSDFQILDRDASLTGRDEIWEHALPLILARPFFGYGYHVFFSTVPSSPAWEFWQHFQYLQVTSLHSSTMGVLAALGVVGLIVMVLLCLRAATVVFNNTIPRRVAEVLLLLLSAFTVSSVTEFNLFYHNGIETFLLFYVFFCAGRSYRPPIASSADVTPTPGPSIGRSRSFGGEMP